MKRYTKSKTAPAKAPVRAPFFGGPLTAILLAISFPPEEQRLLPWFALIPFLLSLYRHRHSALGRWLHGLTCGAILALWLLSPLYHQTVAEHTAPGTETGAGTAVAALLAGLYYGSIVALFAFLWGLFGALSGVLLRQQRLWVPLVGLPLVWTGLEFLRLEFLPLRIPWLALGEAVAPSTPEAQVASLFGLYGLDLTVAFTNAAFLCVLLARSWRRQLLLAVGGCAVFLACHFYGVASIRRQIDGDSLKIGLVKTDRGQREQVSRLTDAILPLAPQLLFLPPGSAGKSPSMRSTVDRLRRLARDEHIEIVAGVDRQPVEPPRAYSFVLVDERGIVTELDRAAPHIRSQQQETSGILEGAVKLGVVMEEGFDTPTAARRLALGGAQVLLGVDEREAHSSDDFARLEARRVALRAVENRRWLLRITRGGRSQIRDSMGGIAAEAPAGADWAVVESVSLLNVQTPFARWGWLSGPLALLGAAVVLIVITVRGSQGSSIVERLRTPNSEL